MRELAGDVYEADYASAGDLDQGWSRDGHKDVDNATIPRYDLGFLSMRRLAAKSRFQNSPVRAWAFLPVVIARLRHLLRLVCAEHLNSVLVRFNYFGRLCSQTQNSGCWAM